MTEKQQEMYNAMLASKPCDSFGVDMIDCAFEFERVIIELEALKKDVESKKPVCPHCKQTMSKVQYKGYYDSGDYWECNCEWEDDAEDVEHRRGAYA